MELYERDRALSCFIGHFVSFCFPFSSRRRNWSCSPLAVSVNACAYAVGMEGTRNCGESSVGHLSHPTPRTCACCELPIEDDFFRAQSVANLPACCGSILWSGLLTLLHFEHQRTSSPTCVRCTRQPKIYFRKHKIWVALRDYLIIAAHRRDRTR